MVLIGIASNMNRCFLNIDVIIELGFKGLPMFTTLIVLLTANKLASRYVFINKTERSIEFQNIWFLNIFTYFYSFYGWAMCFLLSVVKVFGSFLKSILMMPS